MDHRQEQPISSKNREIFLCAAEIAKHVYEPDTEAPRVCRLLKKIPSSDETLYAAIYENKKNGFIYIGVRGSDNWTNWKRDNIQNIVLKDTLSPKCIHFVDEVFELVRILTKMNTHSGRTLTPVILTHCPSDLLH